jgi:hypothetical protein
MGFPNPLYRISPGKNMCHFILFPETGTIKQVSIPEKVI